MGSVLGRYFKCRPKHGLFVRQHMLLTDAEKEQDDLEEEDEENLRLENRHRQARVNAGSRGSSDRNAVLSTSDMLELQGISPPEDPITLHAGRSRRGNENDVEDFLDSDHIPERNQVAALPKRNGRSSAAAAELRSKARTPRRESWRGGNNGLDLIDESVIEGPMDEHRVSVARGTPNRSPARGSGRPGGGHLHISPGGDITIDMPDSTAHTLLLNDDTVADSPAQSAVKKSSDGSGAALLRKISDCIAEDPRRAVGVFEQVDSDDDGLLDQGEAARAFRRLGLQLRLAEIADLFSMSSVVFNGKLMYSSLLALQAAQDDEGNSTDNDASSDAGGAHGESEDDGMSVVVDEDEADADDVQKASARKSSPAAAEVRARAQAAAASRSPLARYVQSNPRTPSRDANDRAVSRPSGTVGVAGGWTVKQPPLSPPRSVHVDPTGSVSISMGAPSAPPIPNNMPPPALRHHHQHSGGNSSVLFGAKTLTPAQATARPGDTRRATGLSLQQTQRRQLQQLQAPAGLSNPAQQLGGPSQATASVRQLPRRRSVRPPADRDTHVQEHAQQEPNSSTVHAIENAAVRGSVHTSHYRPIARLGAEPSVAAVGATLVTDPASGQRSVQAVGPSPAGQLAASQNRSFLARSVRRKPTQWERDRAARTLQITILRLVLQRLRETCELYRG